MNRYHRWYCGSARWGRALEQRVLPWALDGLELGDDALEIGPGPGLTTDLLRRRASRLTCIELDPSLARKLAARLDGANVIVVEGDATQMPFEDGRFSAAVSLTMLHHVPTAAGQDALFAEACRVLRPGGWFAGIDSTPSWRWNLAHLFDTRNPVDPEGLPARLDAAGFADVSVERSPRGGFRFRARRTGASAL